MSFTEDGWHYRPRSGAIFTGRGGDAADMRVVARVVTRANDEEAAYRVIQANDIGRLLAAAPDLLAACKAILSRYTNSPIDGEHFNSLRAAIAKAGGAA